MDIRGVPELVIPSPDPSPIVSTNDTQKEFVRTMTIIPGERPLTDGDIVWIDFRTRHRFSNADGVPVRVLEVDEVLAAANYLPHDAATRFTFIDNIFAGPHVLKRGSQNTGRTQYGLVVTGRTKCLNYWADKVIVAGDELGFTVTDGGAELKWTPVVGPQTEYDESGDEPGPKFYFLVGRAVLNGNPKADRRRRDMTGLSLQEQKKVMGQIDVFV